MKKPLWELSRLEHATNIALAFERTQRLTWSSIWPMGHCLVSTLLLAPLIRFPLEWDVAVAIGLAHNGKPHAWLESPEMDVIDSTYGMFDGGHALRILPAAISHRLGHIVEIRLRLTEEERLRNAIRPSEPLGWDPAVNIMQLFGPHPSLASALKR